MRESTENSRPALRIVAEPTKTVRRRTISWDYRLSRAYDSFKSTRGYEESLCETSIIVLVKLPIVKFLPSGGLRVKALEKFLEADLMAAM